MAYLLTKRASGRCAHGGSATPAAGNPRVKAGGAEVLTVATVFPVSGCPNVVGTSPFPCAVGLMPAAATRVRVMGQPVLLDSGRPMNVPTGVPTTLDNPQQRVKGQ